MERRDFIVFLGGAAAMWPLATQAQQPTPGKWRVGLLAPEIRQKPIHEGLRELGYVEGRNLLIERRFENGVDRLAASQRNWSDSSRTLSPLTEYRRPALLRKRRPRAQFSGSRSFEPNL